MLITASALIWVGVAFAGYAIYLAMLPQFVAPMAAAIAAVVLVTGPLGWALFVVRRRHYHHQPEIRLHQPDPTVAAAAAMAAATPPGADAATLNLLAKVAEQKPLLAVLFAGLLGASEAINQRK